MSNGKNGDGKRPFSIKGLLGLRREGGSSAGETPSSPGLGFTGELSAENPGFRRLRGGSESSAGDEVGGEVYIDGHGRGSYTENFMDSHVASKAELAANEAAPGKQMIYKGGEMQKMSPAHKILSGVNDKNGDIAARLELAGVIQDSLINGVPGVKPKAVTATGPGQTQAPVTGVVQGQVKGGGDIKI